MAWRLLAAAVIHVLGAVTLRAQAITFDREKALTQYKIDRWQTEQGLPLDTVQSLLQSSDGYLWVGTSGGLTRFNGIGFKTWDSPAVRQITSRSVFALMEDSRGAIWIGHSKGASVYRNGRFERGFPDGLTGGRRVWAFAESPDGSVWAASENGLLRTNAGVAKAYRVEDGLPTNRLRALAFDPQGTLWIGTTGGGLVSFAAGRFEGLAPLHRFPRLEVRSVLADPDGTVWAATAGSGLVSVRGGAVKVHRVADGLPTDQLTSLARDGRGTLWIGTWGGGVARLSQGVFTSISVEGGLAADQIWSILADTEGSVWVGTWVGGLNRLSDRPFIAFGAPEGLSSNNVRSVTHAKSGVTWVATSGGGVNRIEDGRVSVIRKRDGLPSDETASVYAEDDGSVWVGTYTAGVARLRAGKIQAFGLADGLPNVDVHAFLRDREGVLWVGTMSGLARLVGGRFVPVHEPGAPRVGVMSLLQDREGVIWSATSEGLFRYRNGVFDTLTQKDGLASSWTLAMYEDAAGSLWVGSNGDGLSRVRDGKIAAIRSEDGLWDGMVQVIIEDKSGHLWMTSNRGFYRASIDELNALADGRATRVTSTGFGAGDGLRSPSFAGGLQPAGALDDQGLLWLPSFNGLVIVDPAHLPGSGDPPRVLLDDVTVNGVTAVADKEVILPPGSAPLSIRYAAATLANADRVRFRYRMDGLTSGWVEAGRNREASFPSLPQGSYGFRVAASTDGEHWREAAVPLVVTVLPFFYQTSPFRLLALLAGLVSVLGIVSLRTHALRRRHAEMERLVAEKTEALRLANEHLSRLSFIDAQTGLANRRRFDETLDKEWRRASRFGTPLAVVMADIDAFKSYNDALGHPEGDKCLAAVAEVFRKTAVRAGDLVARYGGEEFVVLIPSADREAALAFAEKLRQACEARAIRHPASPVGGVVTISLGVAVGIPGDEAAAAALVAEADAALYRAKRAGRNRVA